MSEPDVVPLPREGEVFFDVRGEARSMRLSWYADSKVAVFSIWQGNRCTGTFRLPFADLARMVQTLQSGPPVQAPKPQPQPSPGYSATVAAFDSGPDAGSHYGQDRRYGYGGGAGPDFGPGRQGGYGTADQGYGGDQGYGADQGYGGGYDYGPGSGFAAAPAYRTDRSYGGDLYQPDGPYGASDPYQHSAEPYSPGEPYRGGEQYRATGQYEAGEHYGASEQYRAADQRHQNDPYRPLRDGSDQLGGPGPPGHTPPYYADVPSYRDERSVATGPTVAPHPDDWLPPAGPGSPKRGADYESVPDTAMMSFPSVPARNGPSGYR